MSSYAGQVSDNLQHASDMLEIDRKLSLEKISHQEELLLQKQLECDRILREEKERENQLEGNRDSWRGSGRGRGRDFGEEEEEVEEETRYRRIADSDKKNQNQNYPSFKPSLAGNKRSSIRISENENVNEVEIADDYEDNAESEVEIEVEDEYDNYSISFDLDRSRSRMSNDQKVSKLDRNKTKLDKNDKIEKVEAGDRTYGKSVQYASFNSSVSVSSEMAMVQGRNASGPRSGISPRSGFKGSRREILDSDYSDVFEEVEERERNRPSTSDRSTDSGSGVVVRRPLGWDRGWNRNI